MTPHAQLALGGGWALQLLVFGRSSAGWPDIDVRLKSAISFFVCSKRGFYSLCLPASLGGNRGKGRSFCLVSDPPDAQSTSQKRPADPPRQTRGGRACSATAAKQSWFAL